MRTLKKGMLLGCALLLGALCTPAWAGDEEQPKKDGHDQGRHRGWKKGKGHKGHILKRLIMNVPGVKEERKRFGEALKAIKKEGKGLGEQIKESVKAAEGPEAKKEVLKSFKGQFKEQAGKVADEIIKHHEKITELLKANRENLVEEIISMRMRVRGKKRHGRRDGGPDDEMRGKRRDRMEKRRDHRRRGDKKPAGDTDGAAGNDDDDDDDLAAALEKALE